MSFNILSLITDIKVWINPQGEILSLDEEDVEHADFIWDKFELSYDEALEKGWVRGWIYNKDAVFELDNINTASKKALDTIDNYLKKVPESYSCENLIMESGGSESKQGYISIPMEEVIKLGVSGAYNKAKKQTIMASKKDHILDEIRLENWDAVQAIVTSAQTELSPKEFENQFSPLAIAIDLVKLMGKAGLHFAKEYADNISEMHKDSTFTDGLYTLERNKAGEPFDLEPQSGPYPRALPTIEKSIGDIAPIDRIARVFDSGWISPEGEFICNEGYAHDDVAREMGLGDSYSAIDKGWIRFNIQGNNMYFECKKIPNNFKKIEQFLENNPDSVGKWVGLDFMDSKIYDYIDEADILKYGLKTMLEREDRNIKIKSFSLSYINRMAIELRNYSLKTGSVLDDLRPIASLWYENESGEKYILSDDELMNALMPEDYPYQHSRFPVLTDTVCVQNAPPLLEGHTSMNCIGPIVIALVQNKGWDWVDALTFAASTCERCLNILLEETTGEPYPDRDSAGTHCECCQYVDPEYDNYYKTVVQPEIDRDILEDSHFSCVGFKDLFADAGDSGTTLYNRNTDLAPQSDWRYPVRQEPNPTGHRPFMVDSPPGPKLKETTEDSHIFFFGPSFNQNLTKIKED